jgi:hypothetical protein
MVDLVLRRQILEARKAGKSEITDPTQDASLIDMLFVMLVAVYLSFQKLLEPRLT